MDKADRRGAGDRNASVILREHGIERLGFEVGKNPLFTQLPAFVIFDRFP
jgi:hypothetical protein